MKKGFLFIYLILILSLIGCQSKETYSIEAEGFSGTTSLVLNAEYPGYGLMLAKQDDRPIILVMKSLNQEMQVIRIIRVPVTNEDLKVSSFSFNEQEMPRVTLEFNGQTHEYDTVRRLDFSGHYYALQLDAIPGSFNATVNDGCFGKDIPCPFSPQFDKFISGPYVDYKIVSLLKLQKPRLALPSFHDFWVIIDLSNRVITVLAEYQNNLYHIRVSIENDVLVYESTLVQNNILSASYVGSNQTSLVILENNIVNIYNDQWTLLNAFVIEGDYFRVIKDYTDGPYVIETSTHYYVFKGSSLFETIEKRLKIAYVGTQFIYEPDDLFVYYFLENNQVKFVEVNIEE